MFVCITVYMHAHVCIWMWEPAVTVVFPFTFWDRASHSAWNWSILLDWLASKSSGSATSTETAVVHYGMRLLGGCCESNSGLKRENLGGEWWHLIEEREREVGAKLCKCSTCDLFLFACVPFYILPSCPTPLMPSFKPQVSPLLGLKWLW